MLTSGPIEAVTPAIRAAVADVNRDTTLAFRSLEASINDSLLQPRMVALLSAVFGSLAVVLAMSGFMELRHMEWRGAKARSGYGWRWARSGNPWSG